MAFIRSPVPDGDGLAVHAVLEEAMVAALPGAHALATASADSSLPLTDLAAEPFVLYRRASGPGLHDQIIGACQTAGFSPRIEQEAPRIVATLNLVAASLGVTIVPESLSGMRLEDIVYRPLAVPPRLVAPIRLACRMTDHSVAARRFVSLARREAQAVDGSREQA